MLKPLNLIGSAIIAAGAMISFYISTGNLAESLVGAMFVYAISLFVLDYLRHYLRSVRRKKELLYKNY
ncbi:MAG: hypothetical protein H8D42_00185 [Candidatus Marinimicrobia bacterium]|nr:hypothetical protein [Candidatus Neomarinimicrobiota bacterium]